MDITYDFEFLDLSGVDEYEKNRVLSSLQPLHSTVRFPWFIGGSKGNIEVIKSTKPTLAEPLVVSNNFAPLISKTPRTRITIINPENGLAVPLTDKTEAVSKPSHSMVNGPPRNLPVDSQYYTPVPQYYSPSPVVTTIPSVPVHIPPANYGSYPPAAANHPHPEIPTNTPIYQAFVPSNFPVKTSVYYGVPPAQPIFVSHPSTAETGSFYQDCTSPYGSVEINPAQGVPSQEEWNSGEKNILVNNIQQDSSNILSKKSVSPLSADTPAFTPKNMQNILTDTHQQDFLKTKSVEVPEVQRDVPKLEEENENIVIAVIDKTNTPVETQPENVHIHTTTPKQTPVWGGGKSWASLFTPKDGASSHPELNGLVKPAFPEVVNKQFNDQAISPIKNPRSNHFIDPDCYRMGEFLKNYTVDGKTISIQPRGLINQSNYCYINSILQALIACPPMYNLLSGLAENISSNAKRKPTPVIDGMCKFVKEYKHLPANMRVSNRRSDGGKKDQKKEQGVQINTDIPFEPSWVYKILHGLQSDLMEGRQEDAEEFLGCLLNHLSDEMLELMKLVETPEKEPTKKIDEDEDNWQIMGNKNKGSVLRKTEFARTPITDIFGGSLKSRINRIGGLSTENTQLFLTLPLNIEKAKTVREALEALTTKYQLEGLTSSKTNEQVEAWQQVMLDELPVVLVLHLKCFDFKLDGCTKIVKALEFPIDLKIDGKLLSTKANAKEKQYKLFAVVYHDGKEATKGHYVTDAFHVGYSSWLRYDDASVRPVQEEQVLSPQGTRVPYLLFYRRRNR